MISNTKIGLMYLKLGLVGLVGIWSIHPNLSSLDYYGVSSANSRVKFVKNKLRAIMGSQNIFSPSIYIIAMKVWPSWV